MKRMRVVLFIMVWLSLSCNAYLEAVEQSGLGSLKILSYRFIMNKDILSNRWELEISFSEPVLLQNLDSYVELIQNDIRGQVRISEGDSSSQFLEGRGPVVSSIIISPVAVMSGTVSNRVTIQSGLMSASGLEVLEADYKLQFDSADSFTVSRIEASDRENEVKLHFTDGINLGSVRRSLTLTPYVSIRWYQCQVIDQRIVVLKGDFRRGTTYFMSFKTGFKGVSGRSFTRTVNQFTMPDYASAFRFNEFGGVIERNSRQLLAVESMNTDEILFRGLRIPPVLVPAALSLTSNKNDKDKNQRNSRRRSHGNNLQVETEPEQSFEEVQEELLEMGKLWSHRLRVHPTLDIFSGSVEFEQQLFFQNHKVNEWHNLSIPLAFRDDRELGNIELVQLENNLGDGRSDFRILRITDIGLTAKRSENGLLIWCTSLQTGQPLADINLAAVTKDLEVFYLGNTSRSGVLSVSQNDNYGFVSLNEEQQVELEKTLDFKKVTCILAVSESDETFLELVPDGYIKLKNIDHRQVQATTGRVLKSYVFTERGIYRPGETVHFKALVREHRDGKILVPDTYTCSIVVIDSKGDEHTVLTRSTTEYGTVWGEIALKSYDPLGPYTLFVKHESGKPVLAKKVFEVQEFRAPRHFAEVSFSRTSRTSRQYVNVEREEELLKCTISGKYYAGGPVKHGQVRWKIRLKGTDFNLDKFPDFTFGFPGQSTSEIIESGDSILDTAGLVEVTIPLNDEVLSGKYSIEVSATVIDFDGRASTVTKSFQNKPEILVGIQRHPGSVDAGDGITLRALVIDEKGKKIKSGSLRVDFMKQGWSYIRKRNQYGRSYWESKRVWRRSFTQEVPVKNREASLEFDFAWGGDYLVSFTYTHHGRNYSSGTLFNVVGYYYGYGSDQQQDFEKMQIIPDRVIYEPGQEIIVNLKSGIPFTSALVTIESNGVMMNKVLPEGETSCRIPVDASFTPNVYISVAGTLPRGDFPIYREQYDLQAPSFAFGTINVEVKNVIQRLSLEIGGSRPLTKGSPGEKYSLILQTKDENGQGIQSEIAVGVVDERVLALTAYRTPTLERLLKFTRPLNVFTFEERMELMKQTPFDVISNVPLTGGGGLASAKDISSQIRKNFNPVAYFNPQVLTDDAGSVTIEFTLPDTMTTYRVYAVACDRGARFASQDKPLTVVKDFYMQPGFPRFLRNGDSFSCYVSAFNKINQPGTLEFSVESQDSLELNVEKATVELAGFDTHLFPVNGVVRDVGQTRLLFSGTMGELSDHIQIDLPLLSTYVRDYDVRSGTVTGEEKITYEFPPFFTPETAGSIHDKEMEFLVTVSGSPFLKLKKSLKYLLRYPYGCVEQTSSRVIPLAGLRSVIEKGLVPEITLEETKKYLNSGVERLIMMQTDSGGFAYWPGRLNPNKWGSVYAMTALTLSSRSGIKVPEQVIKDGVKYLKNQARQGTVQEYEYRALVAYILALNGSLDKQFFQFVGNDSSRHNRTTRLLYLLSAYHSNFMDREELHQQIISSLTGTVESENRSYFRARYRPKAISLLAANLLDDRKYADKAAAAVIKGIKKDGRWSSTSDTGWALLALGDYLSGATFSNDEVQITITSEWGLNETFQLKAADYRTVLLPSKSFVSDPSITVKVHPPISVLYELNARYPRIDYQKTGYSNGFHLRKTIKNTDGSDKIRVGDVVNVVVNISIATENDYYSWLRYLVLDDPLPAGLVAINSALKTEETPDNANTDNESYWWQYWEDGYYRFVPNHFEIRDDRVLVFKDDAWRGDYQYSYYARAVAAGTYTVPSSKIQLMYDPDVVGYTRAQTLVILPKR